MTNELLSRSPRALLVPLACLLAVSPAFAQSPQNVSIPGSYQSEAGCLSDWDPACSATQLTRDNQDGIWKGSFSVALPGNYDYKAALNNSWDENYGAKAERNGPNIPLKVDTATETVKFYYDPVTHFVTSNKNDDIIAVVGDFQSEIQCPGDWQPACLRAWLQDIDGDGVYTTTVHLPPGTYQAKVAYNESWDENYGAGGAPGGANIPFTVPVLPITGKDVSFVFNGTTHILEIVVGGIKGDLSRAKAHFVSRDTIAWNVDNPEGTTFQLHAAPAGGLEITPGGVAGGTAIPLTYDPAGLPAAIKARFPHLANYEAFKIAAADQAKVPGLLEGQLAVSAVRDDEIQDATGLQIPGVLDELYTYQGELGLTWSDGKPTLRVWAPTARSVALHLFDQASSPTAGTVVAMTKDGETGTWVTTGEAAWKDKYYLYEVEVYVPSAGTVRRNLVTDPYSISLSTNSKRSQLIDLNDPALQPDGWAGLSKPTLERPEDIVLYELHVRDFSINDYTVAPERRGTFLAFTEGTSEGMKHLKRLASAGVTHVHLLPVFDIATINEDKASREEPKGDLSSFPPDSTKQRDAVLAVKDKDGFNWGYDPFHYNVPEGSYSTNPDGPTRIREFREMVKALNAAGLRVVMDVVYNHTNASGQADKSVLDKVVPGYYHRLNADGMVERSTCCENTATEHAMMEKLMVDSVKLWATAYKVDGFRFDLMGHHMKSNMLKVRDTLAGLTPEKDGVDGARIYIYGEGWNFGEVVNGARGENATQLNMAGTGIGTFTDRLRDAARGGSPFAPKPMQGFITGLFLTPNGSDQGSTLEQLARLRNLTNLVMVGLAANLKDYFLYITNGDYVKGSQVPYNDQPGGYASDPQEVINYVSAHDNETLFDAIQAKLPVDTSMDDRVRAYNLGISLVLLAQGIPFFHAGDELLRSKSGDPNSYDSGDWFNRIDWTYRSNNWGVGLPPGGDDAFLGPLLKNPALKPDRDHIVRALNHFEEMLLIRKSSQLFRLETGEQVMRSVRFHNVGKDSIPGLVVMSIYNSPRFPGEYDQVVVLFNAAPEERQYGADIFRNSGFALHPILQQSVDPVIAKASYDERAGTFKVPPRTAAVFVTGVRTPTQCGCGQASGTGLGALGLVLAGALFALRRRAAR